MLINVKKRKFHYTRF